MIPALVVDALAAYRLTRLVTSDRIADAPRDAVVLWAYSRAGRGLTIEGDASPGAWSEAVAQDPDPPKLAYLVTCPWCSSWWIGLAVVAMRRLAPRWWAPMAEALALSAVAGLVAEKSD